MKEKFHSLRISLVFAFLIFVFSASAQNIAVNTSGASADSSAVFDISSANRGLLIPRISLTDLNDASSVSGPATSLLVYNTNASLPEGTGFYYNGGTPASPSWVKLVSSGKEWKLGGNAATVPGSDFIGTTDSVDLLFKTKNVQRLQITGSGNTLIGDASNHALFDPDGSLSLEGTATAYNDIVVPLFNSRLGNNNQAVWTSMKNNGSGSRGVYTFTFEDQSSASNEEEVFFSVQLPHNWKEGSTLYPHVHWSPQAASSGSVVWGLEFTWVNYDATTPVTFPNTTIINATSAAVSSGDVDKHLITSFGSLTPSASQNKISSILMCRFYRKSADAADTYTGNAAVLSVDFHYEIDGIGSHQQYIK